MGGGGNFCLRGEGGGGGVKLCLCGGGGATA